MPIAMRDLRLDRLYVVHAGKDTFPMDDRIMAVAARRLIEDVTPLRRG